MNHGGVGVASEVQSAVQNYKTPIVKTTRKKDCIPRRRYVGDELNPNVEGDDDAVEQTNVLEVGHGRERRRRHWKKRERENG